MIADANEVMPRLWVGPAASCDAAPPDVVCICVLEAAHSNRCHHMRILADDGKTDADRINSAIDMINANWPQHVVLVHCGGGQERSPLAVVHWLMRSFNLSLDEAYTWLIKQRPVAQDRRSWIR